MRTIIFLSAIMISIAINESSVTSDMHSYPQGYAIVFVIIIIMDVIEWIKNIF